MSFHEVLMKNAFFISGLIGGVILSASLSTEAVAQSRQKRKTPKKKPAETQINPATLPVGVQEMLRTSSRNGVTGEVTPAPASQPAYNGMEQSPKPNRKRAIDNGDFGAPPRDTVRENQEKKAASDVKPEAGGIPEAPPPADPLQDLKKELRDLQNDLSRSENSDSSAEVEKAPEIRSKIYQLSEKIKKLEAERQSKGQDPTPKP
jgi:hypothetical protein